MNDFLQSIRNGSFSKDNGNNSKPRYNSQRPRRAYEPNGNYPRNNGNEQKFRPRMSGNGLPADETLVTIKDTLASILTSQEASLAFAERRAIAEERKAEAFEFIANHIARLTGEDFIGREHATAPITQTDDTPCDTVDAAPQAEMETEVSASDMNKDDILAIIADMRRDGSTYHEIASHLVDLNLPTFSGRGKWHAQTIHRLCQTA